MLEHYSHVRLEAKRKAVASLDSQICWRTNRRRTLVAIRPLNQGPHKSPHSRVCELRKRWSGRADLNCRPLAPQASALPG